MSIGRFLIIGFGGAGQREKNAIERLFPACKIAVWDTGGCPAELPESIVKIHDLEEALAFESEGVFIATPTSTHIQYAEPFLGRAKFILIDKPLDAALNQCEVFVRSCQTTSTKVYLNFQRRFMPCWQTLKECVAHHENSEFLYGLVQIESYYPEWRPNKSPSELYAARVDLGGGVLLTECHEFDLIQWILGRAVVRVSAQLEGMSSENKPERNAQLLLSIDTTRGERTISVVLDYLSLKKERKMELHFKDAIYIVDEFRNSVTKIEAGGGMKSILVPEDTTYTPYEALLRAVVQMGNGGGYGDVPQLEDGLSVNAIIHAAKKAQSGNSWEAVTPSICPAEGVASLNFAIQKLQATFKNRLIAVYGMGSLGYGGYVNGWSDFDVDIIVEATYESAAEDYRIGKQIEREVQEMGFERIDLRVYSHEHLNTRKTVLTYGQCSRASMLCDTAVLLAGRDIRKLIIRPTRHELNTEAIGLLKNLLSKGDIWWSTIPWDDIAAHFALATRFLYTYDFGLVAGKRQALEYFIEKKASLFSKDILRWVLWALSCRLQFHPLLLQDSLREEASNSLRALLGQTLVLLEKEMKG